MQPYGIDSKQLRGKTFYTDSTFADYVKSVNEFLILFQVIDQRDFHAGRFG